MLAFRSEGHVERWSAARRIPTGAVLSIEQVWALGEAWYASTLSPDWRRRTPAEAEEVFRAIGLTSDFWHLT